MANITRRFAKLFEEAGVKLAAAPDILWIGGRSDVAASLMGLMAEQKRKATLEVILPQVSLKKWWEGVATTINVCDLPTLAAREGGWANMVVLMPHKDRELTNAWAACAMHALKQRGYMLVVGARDEGVEPLEKRVGEQLTAVGDTLVKPFGRATVYRKEHEAVVAAPEVKEFGFKAQAGGAELMFKTLPGVFSKTDFDDGAKALLAVLEVSEGDRMLDLGCGPGTIGLLSLQKTPGLKVTLSDDDANAVAAAKMSAKLNHLHPEDILLADSTGGLTGQKFDVIVLNPPFHAGKEVSYALAEKLTRDADFALVRGGRFYLVCNKFCPYEQFLKKLFGKVEVASGDARYTVWKCTK